MAKISVFISARHLCISAAITVLHMEKMVKGKQLHYLPCSNVTTASYNMGC